MNITSEIQGSSKAGNTKRIKAKLIVIDWERETIMHRYEVETVDADGDVLKTEESNQVLLGSDKFQEWINQAMKEATIETISEHYNQPEEEV